MKRADLTSRMLAAIERYGMSPDKSLAVACSGGKDSLLLALTLQELGFETTAYLVDLNYDPAWAPRVGETLRQMGVAFEVLAPAHKEASAFFDVSTLMRANLDVLSAPENTSGHTPCTACYNTKVLALNQALGETRAYDRIAFGHHATDSAASLLKSALMYIDRWDRGEVNYDRDRFRALCVDLRDDCLHDSFELFERCTELVSQGLASTDEPPIQRLLVDHTEGPFLVRPMIDIWESEIAAAMSDLGLRTEPSGCGHTATIGTQTPREVVQFEVVRHLEMIPEWRARISDLISRGVKADGTIQSDSRRNRDALLGDTYKPSRVRKL